MKFILGFILLMVCTQVHAQGDAEQQIKYYLDQMQYWRYEYSPDDSGVNPDASPKDSLAFANKSLAEYLLNNTSLLRNDMKTVEEAGMKIATSDDRRLRIYSWDTETGDEKHVYKAVAQYETGSGIKAQEIGQTPGSLYNEIHAFGSGKKCYVAVASAIRSQKDAVKGVHAFSIEGTKLNDASIFQGKSVLEYSYDYFSNYDYKSMKEKSVLRIEKGKILFPIVENEKVTDQWRTYEFDGNQFKMTK